MKRRLSALKVVVALAVLSTLLVIPAERALACSCAPYDPVDAIDNSDGAFVGTFQESHPTDPPVTSSDEDTIYTFTVDEAFKGDFGPVAEVHSAYDGASCGLEIPPGEQAGLLLTSDAEGLWHSNLCSMTAPDDLRDAAQPLPEPDGQGPPAFLWGGSLGDVRTIAFDPQGRILGYGGGDGDVYGLDVCPSGGLAAEVFAPAWPARFRVALRDLGSMDEAWSVELPLRRRTAPQVIDVSCRDTAGEQIHVAVLNYRKGGSILHIYSMSDEGPVEVFTGRARDAAIVEDEAYIVGGKNGTRLSRVDLASGDKELVAKVPDDLSHLEANAAGTKLATVAAQNDVHESLLVKIALKKGRVVTKKLGRVYGSAQWWGTDKLVLLPAFYGTKAAIYGSDLEPIDTFVFQGGPAAIVGDRIYGAFNSAWVRTTFHSASLATGEAETMFEIMSPVSFAMEPAP